MAETGVVARAEPPPGAPPWRGGRARPAPLPSLLTPDSVSADVSFRDAGCPAAAPEPPAPSRRAARVRLRQAQEVAKYNWKRG